MHGETPKLFFLDFKISPRSKCYVLSSGNSPASEFNFKRPGITQKKHTTKVLFVCY